VQNTTIGIFISHHNFTKFTVTFTKEKIIYKLEGKEEQNHRKKKQKTKNRKY